LNVILLLVSGLAMFIARLGANFEFDLKIIALSTLRQLGLMISRAVMMTGGEEETQDVGRRVRLSRGSRGHRVTTSGELRYPPALLHAVTWSE